MTYQIVSERKLRYPVKISDPKDVYQAVKRYTRAKEEQFIVLTLNGTHEIISICIVSIGLVNKTIVHPREVFNRAIQDMASAIIVCHNHPSGKTEPSPKDLEVTTRIAVLAFSERKDFNDVRDIQ